MPVMIRAPLVLAALVRVASYPAHPMPVDPIRNPWQATTCVIDVGQAIGSAGEVAGLLTSATIVCPETKDPEEKAICSAALGDAMAALLYVVSYTSAALVDCIDTANVSAKDAACAADVSGFLNGLVTAWGASSALASGICSDLNGTNSADERDINLDGAIQERRLRGRAAAAAELAQTRVRQLKADMPSRKVDPKLLPEYNQYRFLKESVPDYDQFIEDVSEHQNDIIEGHQIRDIETAFCVFDVGHAVMYLTRATAAIHASVQNCAPSKLGKREGDMKCTVNLAGVIGSLIYTALYINFIVLHCPSPPNIRSICAAGVMSSMTVVTSLIAASADFDLSCGSLRKGGNEVVFPNRRLAQNTSGAAELFV